MLTRTAFSVMAMLFLGHTMLAQEIRGAKILAVSPSTTPYIKPSTVIEKLPSNLKPDGPSRVVLILIKMAPVKMPDKGSMSAEIKSSDFALSYKIGTKDHFAQCVGLSLGTYWMFAESGDASVFAVYNSARDIRSEKLLFLVPKNVVEFTVLVNQADGKPVTIKRIRLAK